MSTEGKHSSNASTRGFTLLEVMIAISILGLSLSVILGAQAGLFSSTTRSRNLTMATALVRCKMNEVELDLVRKGYSLTDEHDTGRCCDDDESNNFQCDWRVERVQLPDLGTGVPLGGDGSAGASGDGPMGASSSSTTSPMGSAMPPPSSSGDDESAASGPLGALQMMRASGGLSLGANPELGDLANALQPSEGSPGSMGLVSMAMGLVYPNLKSMLEASIRRVTVTVHWKEGISDRTFEVVQYVTDPQQGGLDPNAAQGLAAQADAVQEMLGDSQSSTTGTGATK